MKKAKIEHSPAYFKHKKYPGNIYVHDRALIGMPVNTKSLNSTITLLKKNFGESSFAKTQKMWGPELKFKDIFKSYYQYFLN